MRRHVRPSIESKTVPAPPTSQQTDGDGEDPAFSVWVVPVTSVRQVDPASADRCTPPPGSSRNRVEGFDETTITSRPAANAIRDAAAISILGPASAGAIRP